jgi:hypothetical protein
MMMVDILKTETTQLRLMQYLNKADSCQLFMLILKWAD